MVYAAVLSIRSESTLAKVATALAFWSELVLVWLKAQLLDGVLLLLWMRFKCYYKQFDRKHVVLRLDWGVVSRRGIRRCFVPSDGGGEN